MPEPEPVGASMSAPLRRRRGRPRHAPSSVRSEIIGVRVTAAEYAELHDKAKKYDLLPAQWVCQVALSWRLPPSAVPVIDREEYAELARLSGTIN